MLNELISLASSMEQANVSTSVIHKEYNPIPAVSKKKPCYQLLLDGNGSIADIHLITEEKFASGIKRYGNKHQSFPAFNIRPIYRISSEQYSQVVDGKIHLCDLLTDEAFLWENKDKDRVNRCFNKGLLEVKTMLIGNTLPVMSELLVRMAQFAAENDSSKQAKNKKKTYDSQFMKALSSCALRKYGESTSPDEKKAFLDLLVLVKKTSESKEKTADNDEGKLSIVLDVYENDSYGYAVAHSRTTEEFNKILLKYESSTVKPTPTDMEDAFQSSYVDPNELMPTVKVDGMEIILRSMNKDILCQTRYDRISTQSYPISKGNRTRAKTALEWITDVSRKGETWNSFGDDRVIVYPDKVQNSESPTVNLLSLLTGRYTGNKAVHKEQFTALAGEFLKRLSSLSPEMRPDTVRIIVLKKMDKARRKVVLSQTATSAHLKSCVEEWNAGFDNVPSLRCSAVDMPFPYDIADILNPIWKQDGSKVDVKKPVKILKRYEGINLFLNIYSQSDLQLYLHKLIVHSEGLIFNTALHNVCEQEIQADNCCKILMMIGFLLYKLNFRKDMYMDSMSYLLGQMLQLSDKIHFQYCLDVRSGSIPTQLVGNAMFTMASEHPNQILGMLGERMMPYMGWAQKYAASHAENSNLVGWFLKQYSETAEKLAVVLKQTDRLNDYEKGELFIGYLAKFPTSEENS